MSLSRQQSISSLAIDKTTTVVPNAEPERISGLEPIKSLPALTLSHNQDVVLVKQMFYCLGSNRSRSNFFDLLVLTLLVSANSVTANECPVWMAPTLQGSICCSGFGRVQSCVRPVSAVLITAGLDGMHGQGPILLIGL